MVACTTLGEVEDSLMGKAPTKKERGQVENHLKQAKRVCK